MRSNVINKLAKLRKNEYQWSRACINKELDEIDAVQISIALKAEKKCRKIKTGQVPFALNEVQQYGKEIRLWTMVNNKNGGQKISSKLMDHHARALKIRKYMNLISENFEQRRGETIIPIKKKAASHVPCL